MAASPQRKHPMATTPPTDTMMQPMAPETMDQPAEATGYTICIKVGADGSLSVGTERESAEEAAEEYASFTPAENIKDALTQALEIYKSDGQAEAAEAEFDAGFAGRGGMQG